MTTSSTTLHGDCLVRMAQMDANSVDLIVTDPPYGLEFMGKEWDKFADAPRKVRGTGGREAPFAHHAVALTSGRGAAFQAWCTEWGAAALRVAKPGAHLFAFGGTRTFHRLTCAIEDAGWEIRDCLMWVYGSGFPKSANQHGEWEGWGTALKPAHEEIIWATKPFPSLEEQRTIVGNLLRLEAQLWSLLPASTAEASFRLSPQEHAEVCASAPWTADERRSTRDALCAPTDTWPFELATISCLSTVMSWRRTLGAPSAVTSTCITEAESSTTIGWRTLRSCVSALTPHRIIQAAMQAPGFWCDVVPAARILSAASESIKGTRELSALVSAMSEGHISPQDVGELAVEPAYEPIILARKPLDGTVAANVQKWGTGALNIDGCRVPTSDASLNGGRVSAQSDGWDRPWKHDVGAIEACRERGRHSVSKAEKLGRWPANLLHDGSQMVLDLFPQSTSGANPTRRSSAKFKNAYGAFGGQEECESVRGAESGSAARFYYCAKASRTERGNGNGHPTVKPIALMRYLVRLGSGPTPGLVLDPFLGSGTTGIAALLEGQRFVGIEREEEYVEIAQRRMEGVSA